MKLFRNILNKNQELNEEEKEQLESMLNPPQNNNSTTADPINTLHESIKTLNLEQIDQLRDLINQQEEKLHEIYGLKEEKESQKKNNYNGEIDIQSPIHEEDLNNKTYDEKTQNITTAEKINNFKKDEDDYLEFNDEEYINDITEDNDNDNTTNNINNTEQKENDIYLKILQIFGEKNVFREFLTNLNDKLPKNKEITCIGIRNKEAFEKDNDETQNLWFISKIKQLNELQNFKILISTPTQKNLFWDREKNPILISYKSTSILNSTNEFSFD